MKSILIITQEMKVGGLGTHLRSEISSLAGAGCCVHLAAGSLPNGFLIPPEVASVTSILPLGAKATVSDLKATVEALGQLVREHSIECVHAHSHVSLIPGFIAAEMNAIPFVSQRATASKRIPYNPQNI